VLLDAFDGALKLHPVLKDAVSTFGACIIRNVRLPVINGNQFQHNISPDLQFHVDRGSTFDSQYSLFYRNPENPEHRESRITSTVIIANSGYCLQAKREGIGEKARSKNSVLFSHESIRNAVGEVVLEQPWSAPSGTGEMCVIDNRAVMHASFHRETRGYKIAVQYLS
jgi:hypothetical protein